MRLLTALTGCAPLLAFGALAATAATPSPLPADPLSQVQSLAMPPSPHWIWVNDFVFPHMTDGKAMLVDGDSGRLLGELDTGFGFARVVPSADGTLIFSPETYFARGTRGARTDVVTIYDAARLAPVAEIEVPPKRSSNMPMMANAVLTEDGRFLLIYNFNPAQSISVVDTQARTFVGEIETAGCALAFPTSARTFFSLCADGALLKVRLDDAGRAAGTERTAPIFDVQHDPATEKGVRVADTWYFVSYGGTIYPVVIRKDGDVSAGPRWALLSDAERAQQWRPGGLQQLAAHAGLNRLYAIMHRGGPETHKEPGRQVWVYDLARHTRVQKITMKNDSGSIQVSRDTQPLLFSIFIGSNLLDVYDAASGKHLRTVPEIGTTPTIMVNP